MKFQLLIKGKMVHNKDFSWFNIVTVFILLINVKMPTIVENIYEQDNFIFSWAEYEFFFYKIEARKRLT